MVPEVPPTVELHRHFEAGLAPETIAHLAEKNGVTSATTRAGVTIEGLDPQDPDSIRRYYRSVAAGFKGAQGFPRFMDSFGLPLSVLRSLDDLEHSAFEQIVQQAEAGSLHTEVRGSPMSYQPLVHASVNEIIEALRSGVERAWTERGASGTYIVAFSRQKGLGPTDGPLEARQAPIVCESVAKLHDADRPLGLDIAGFPEVTYPPRLFEAVTAPLREAGVPMTIHCGEQARAPDYADAPAELIVEAIERLGVRRVGHGTSLIASAAASEAVRSAGVGIECCPRSNLLMGFIDRIEDHPLRRFLAAGLLASIATDDPLMFGDQSVSRLLADTADALGIGVAERHKLVENGLATAFVSPTRRQQLHSRWQALTDGED